MGGSEGGGWEVLREEVLGEEVGRFRGRRLGGSEGGGWEVLREEVGRF